MSTKSSQFKRIKLRGRRTLLAAISYAAKPTRNWIVFLPESGSGFRLGNRAELSALVGTSLANKFNFLVVNKTGLEFEKVERDVFEESFRRQKRISDAVATLKDVVPKNDRIHLVGYSEGAYLAPQVARLDKRIKTVTMIGGGTRGWLKEELNNTSKRERPLYEKKIKEIYRKPSSKLIWNGFSHATWYSYRGDNTLRALKGLKLPTLAILGARDRVIDLKTTIVDLMLVSENQPIQLHVFGDCGHYFTKHWLPVSRVLARFLIDHT